MTSAGPVQLRVRTVGLVAAGAQLPADHVCSKPHRSATQLKACPKPPPSVGVDSKGPTRVYTNPTATLDPDADSWLSSPEVDLDGIRHSWDSVSQLGIPQEYVSRPRVSVGGGAGCVGVGVCGSWCLQCKLQQRGSGWQPHNQPRPDDRCCLGGCRAGRRCRVPAGAGREPGNSYRCVGGAPSA